MKRSLIVLSIILAMTACKAKTEVREAPQYSSQAIELPGVSNARQLGGYVIGNKQVRMDVLIRSGALAKASDEALETLQDRFKLALVTDFRTSQERGSAPDREVEGAENVWLPIIEKRIHSEESNTMMALYLSKDNPSFTLELLRQADIQKTIRSSYDSIVFDEDYQRNYAAFLDRLVALPEGRAALWHCSHGKDRCGWGTAFVLAALGADRDLIVADFGLSNVPYSSDIEELTAFAVAEGAGEDTLEDIKLLRGASEHYFEKTLDEIDARYGSMDNFLEQALSLTPAEKKTLRKKFLVPLSSVSR